MRWGLVLLAKLVLVLAACVAVVWLGTQAPASRDHSAITTWCPNER